jgi:hypothetical protein
MQEAMGTPCRRVVLGLRCTRARSLVKLDARELGAYSRARSLGARELGALVEFDARERHLGGKDVLAFGEDLQTLLDALHR